MKKEKLEKLLNSFTINGESWGYWVTEEDIEDCQSGEEACEAITDKLEQAVYESSEIIYYHNAILFLKENDNSLHRSLDIAQDMGYSLKDLNSEILASLLNAEINRENLYDDLKTFSERFDEIVAG